MMTAVREAAAVAGWVLAKPHVLRDRYNREMELTVAAPSKLQFVFYRQARAHQALEAAAKRAADYGLADSVRESGVDEVSVRRVLSAGGQRALDPEARERLRVAFAGGFSALVDLHRRGIIQSGECPRCGRIDTSRIAKIPRTLDCGRFVLACP